MAVAGVLYRDGGIVRVVSVVVVVVENVEQKAEHDVAGFVCGPCKCSQSIPDWVTNAPADLAEARIVTATNPNPSQNRRKRPDKSILSYFSRQIVHPLTMDSTR